MAITRASGNTVQGWSTTASTSRTLAFANAITSGGSLLVALVTTVNSADTTISVSDSVNGAYTVATRGGDATTNHAWCIAYFYNSASGSTPTVTASGVTAATGVNIFLCEYLGVQSSSDPLDGANNAFNHSGAASASNSGALNTTAAGVVVGLIYQYSQPSTTAGSGYTKVADGNALDAYQFWEDNLSATSGTNAVTSTSTAAYWMAAGAAFKAAAGGPAALPLRSEFAFQSVNRASTY